MYRQKGQTLLEYVLLVALVALVVTAGIIKFREPLNNMFDKAGRCVSNMGNQNSCN